MYCVPIQLETGSGRKGAAGGEKNRDLRGNEITWHRRAARETAFLAAASSAPYGLPASSGACDMAVARRVKCDGGT
jgi:hypothetical protein